jgi:hypothetical protein
MEMKIPTTILEASVSRCYEACQKKSDLSVIKIECVDKKITVSSKGAFTYYEEKLPIPDVNVENFVIHLKTSTFLEFLKHISSSEIVMSIVLEKKSCLVASADKKSKMALQILEPSVEKGQIGEFTGSFSLSSWNEFINTLNHASKFSSDNINDHLLKWIHCEIVKPMEVFHIKSSNGSTFFSSEYNIEIDTENSLEFYLHKKCPVILRDIFNNLTIEFCQFNSRVLMFSSGACELYVYIEKSDENSFPEQAVEIASRPSEAQIRVSAHELTKSLKFFNSVLQDATINFKVKDGKFLLVTQDANLAAKEDVITEICDGEATDTFHCKKFVDCLDALGSSWVELHFIKLVEDKFCCKMTNVKGTSILTAPERD